MELLLFPIIYYRKHLFTPAGGRTDGENPAPPDQRAAPCLRTKNRPLFISEAGGAH